jgi:hypothetical protein
VIDSLSLIDLFTVGAVRIDNRRITDVLLQKGQIEETIYDMDRAGRAMTHRLDAEQVMVKIIKLWGFLYDEGNVPDLGHGNLL